MERVVNVNILPFYRINSFDVKCAIINLRQLTFEMTDACNMNCIYCCYGELYEGYDQRNNSDISFHKIRRTIDFLSDLYKSSNSKSDNQQLYISFYGGEPLLCMDVIKKTISYIEMSEIVKFRDIRYNMTTNGVLLNEYMDFLVDKGVELLVSIDGDEKGNAYRINHAGKNMFMVVYENLKKIQIKYTDYFNNKINLNSVLHNMNNTISTLLFFKDEFDKIPSLSPLSSNCVKPDKKSRFDNMYIDYESVLSQFNNSFKISGEYGMTDLNKERFNSFFERNSNNYFSDYNDLIYDRDRRPVVQTGTCLPFAKKMFITVHGKILPCERISQDYFYGIVTDNEFVLDFGEVASRFNNILSYIEPLCSKCAQNRSCTECVYQGINRQVNLPNCSYFCSEKKLNEYKNINLNYLSKNPSLYEYLFKREINR